MLFIDSSVDLDEIPSIVEFFVVYENVCFGEAGLRGLEEFFIQINLLVIKDFLNLILAKEFVNTSLLNFNLLFSRLFVSTHLLVSLVAFLV